MASMHRVIYRSHGPSLLDVLRASGGGRRALRAALPIDAPMFRGSTIDKLRQQLPNQKMLDPLSDLTELRVLTLRVEPPIDLLREIEGVEVLQVDNGVRQPRSDHIVRTLPSMPVALKSTQCDSELRCRHLESYGLLGAFGVRDAWRAYPQPNKPVNIYLVDHGWQTTDSDLESKTTHVAGTPSTGFAEKRHGGLMLRTAGARLDGKRAVGISPSAQFRLVAIPKEWANCEAENTLLEAVHDAIEQPRPAVFMVGVALGQGTTEVNLSEGVGFRKVIEVATRNGVHFVLPAGNTTTLQRKPESDCGAIVVAATKGETAPTKSAELDSDSGLGCAVHLNAWGNNVFLPYSCAAADGDVHVGTSAASAIVSGIVACVVQRHPDLTPYEVRNLLINTGHTNVPLNGGRSPDLYRALSSPGETHQPTVQCDDNP